MKYKPLRAAAIFFGLFYRPGGGACPPGSATAISVVFSLDLTELLTFGNIESKEHDKNFLEIILDLDFIQLK